MVENIYLFQTKALGLMPSRLREAREACGFNMTELAEKIGVTPQAVSQYESKIKQPDSSTMMRICSVLHQPISYFTTERPPGGDEECTVFFRSFRSKTKTTNKRLDVWRRWAGQYIAFLSQKINFPKTDLPEIPLQDSYDDKQIERIATNTRRFWGLGDGPISNVVALLESKGIVVIRASFSIDDVDAFSCWQNGRPCMFLGSDKACAVRSRFDAAHELAHLLLHRHISRDQIEMSKTLDRVEQEANRFASAFLLPANTFPSEVFSASLSNFFELKLRWKASAAAMIQRCKQLGIFDDYQYVNLRKRLSSHGYLHKEPLDDKITIESPTLLQKATKLLIESGTCLGGEIISDVRLAADSIALIGGFDESLLIPRENQLIELGVSLNTQAIKQ